MALRFSWQVRTLSVSHTSQLTIQNPVQAKHFRCSIKASPSVLPCQVCTGCANGFQDVPGNLLLALPIHTPQALTPTSPWPRWLCSVVNMSLSFGVIVVVAWLGFEIWETSISATENTKVRNKKDVKEKLLAEFSNPSYFRHTFPEIGN